MRPEGLALDNIRSDVGHHVPLPGLVCAGVSEPSHAHFQVFRHFQTTQLHTKATSDSPVGHGHDYGPRSVPRQVVRGCAALLLRLHSSNMVDMASGGCSNLCRAGWSSMRLTSQSLHRSGLPSHHSPMESMHRCSTTVLLCV